MSVLPWDSVLEPFFMADSILLPLGLYLLQTKKQSINHQIINQHKQKRSIKRKVIGTDIEESMLAEILFSETLFGKMHTRLKPEKEDTK
jgi:hypothetical protein